MTARGHGLELEAREVVELFCAGGDLFFGEAADLVEADFSTAKLPADADLELATQQYAACLVCHAAIDPIAGHFRNYGTSGQYRPGSKMPNHLPAAAFLGQSMPAGDTMDPVHWLGTVVAQHPRFALEPRQTIGIGRESAAAES